MEEILILREIDRGLILYLLYPFKIVGRHTLGIIRELGKMANFLSISIYYLFFPPYLFDRVLKQIYFIGVKTTLVIVLTGLFTGMVLTLQGYYVLVSFGAESQLGAITSMSLVRELGPVITALMVIGRAASALSA